MNHFEKICSIKISNTYFSEFKSIMADFIYPNDQTVANLECDEAFCNLTRKEKLYAHYLSRASWYGGLIVLLQTSSESPLIFTLLHNIFRAETIDELKEKALSQCGFTEDDFTAFLVYASGIFFDMGNYKSFGDLKFVPNLPKEKFKKLVLSSKAASLNFPKIQRLLNNCLEKIFSLQDGEKQLGFPEIGITTYLSKNITKQDCEIMTNFLKNQKLELYNTRAFKTTDETGVPCYEIRFASILSTDDSEDRSLLGSHDFKGSKFIFTRGDYSKLLERVNENLLKAKEYAANEIEIKIIDNYMSSFRTGSLESHKKGSALWIRDKKPIIEMYIGFIENYRDPDGQRAQFEGFVAVVNKPMSAKFEALVDAADDLLPFLPWPNTYENKKMIKPDFTSLDILTFGGGESPIGICIPNYQDIRQNDGFKNVSLGNVIISCRKGSSPNHLLQKDKELLLKHFVGTTEMCVGLHEFLGHGSGKLFKKEKDGFNFDDSVLDLETQKKITSWYNEGETYDSVFGALGGSFEECRAESVALYLSTVPEVLRIFGYKDAEQIEEISYVAWLDMAYHGLLGLKCYQPSTNSWLQAHSQAGFVILRVLLEAGEDFVQIKEITGEDGNPDIVLTLDKNKIMSVGRPAFGEFLKKLQLYRCTANITKARAMFERYSLVNNDETHPFLKYREIVIARKKPRKMLIQPNTVIEDGEVTLKTYESSIQGMLQSWIERFSGDEMDSILEELWQKDHLYFQ